MGRAKEITMKVIPSSIANPFIKAHHYSGKVVNNSKLHFGVFLDGQLHGVMGYERTGCVFCMFGAHLDAEPTRFQRLQRTHPQLWRYCMKDWEAGGLGMRSVLEYIGIPYENYQRE